MGWMEPRSRTQAKMIRMYHRLVCMSPKRLTNKIFLWDYNISESARFATWSKETKQILSRTNLQEVFNLNIFDVKETIEKLKASLLQKDLAKLKTQCSMPKLRTYNLIAEFSTEKMYLLKPLSFIQRKSMAKVRLGVLQLRIEIGRYERPKKPAEQRICQQCSLNQVEDELHFVLRCPRHGFMRDTLLSQVSNESFGAYSEIEKLKFLLNSSDIVKNTSQFIINAFDNRLTL